jgi:AraC family transcriptional regulator
MLNTPDPAINGHIGVRAAYRAGRVARAVCQMRTRPQYGHTLESLASVAALSPYHFNRVFRLVTGTPPTRFLCAVRIDAAKRLLLTSTLNVTEICFEVGYKSLGTFVARFTQLVGVSPGTLRRAAATVRSAQLRMLLKCSAAPPYHLGACPGDLTGWINVPAGFDGLIFVGLFDSLMPHAAPVRCQILGGSGHFRLTNIPSGTWRVAAAAIPWSDCFAEMLLGCGLQASSKPLDLSSALLSTPLYLVLHAPQPHEPPILAALPLLAMRAAEQSQASASSIRSVDRVVPTMLP